MISAVVITKDEEGRIRACLERLAWCDEVLVVDSLSQDGTVEIAKSMGAKVLIREWDGFAGQKNFGMEHTIGDWILFVEADEWITLDLQNEILAVLKTPDRVGYQIPRLNYFLGEPVWHSDLYPDYQLRLIQKGKGRYTEDTPPHESIRVTGKVGYLIHHMIHNSYSDLSSFVEKMDRYTDVAAKDMASKGKRFYPTVILFRSLARWIKIWVFERGFLDGYRGLILAWLYAFYVFCKYAKLWELELREKTLSS